MFGPRKTSSPGVPGGRSAPESGSVTRHACRHRLSARRHPGLVRVVEPAEAQVGGRLGHGHGRDLRGLRHSGRHPPQPLRNPDDHDGAQAGQVPRREVRAVQYRKPDRLETGERDRHPLALEIRRGGCGVELSGMDERAPAAGGIANVSPPPWNNGIAVHNRSVGGQDHAARRSRQRAATSASWRQHRALGRGRCAGGVDEHRGVADAGAGLGVGDRPGRWRAPPARRG